MSLFRLACSHTPTHREGDEKRKKVTVSRILNHIAKNKKAINSRANQLYTHRDIHTQTHKKTQSKTTKTLYSISNIKDSLGKWIDKKGTTRENRKHTLRKGKRGKKKRKKKKKKNSYKESIMKLKETTSPTK